MDSHIYKEKPALRLTVLRFHQPIFMRILEYHIKNLWKETARCAHI